MANDKFSPRRKKKIPGNDSSTTDTKKKTPSSTTERMTVDLPENVYTAVKMYCIEHKLFLKDYVADVFEREMKIKGKL